VEAEALISRPEVEAMLLAIFDISANMKRLVGFIEGEDDGEEEEEAP
jgi:hypothetical protein